MECAGFLRGFNEGVNLKVQLSAGATKIQLSQPWCTLETGTDVQLGLVLVKYIRAHSETAHLRTTVLASLAYFEAFACQGKTRPMCRLRGAFNLSGASHDSGVSPMRIR